MCVCGACGVSVVPLYLPPDTTHTHTRACSPPHALTAAVYHMMETGWVKVSSSDVGPLYYDYMHRP